MEKEFIPVEVAKNQVTKIEEDMKQMHKRHVELVEEMDKNYKMIEFKTQEHFTEFLGKWKALARAKIEQYKAAFNEIKAEKETIQVELQPVLLELRSENKKLRKDYEELLDKYNADIQAKRKELKDREELLGSEYQEELAKLKQDNVEMKGLLDDMGVERKSYQERSHVSMQKVKEKLYAAKETAREVASNYIQDCASLVVNEIVNEVERRNSKQNLFEITRSYKLKINALKKELEELKRVKVEMEKLGGDPRKGRDSGDLTETATVNQTANQVRRNDSSKANVSSNFAEDIHKYDRLLEARKGIIKQIKSWRKEFELREKRKCAKDDCKPISDLFRELKEINQIIRSFKGERQDEDSKLDDTMVSLDSGEDTSPLIEEITAENTSLKQELEELRNTLSGKVTKDKVLVHMEKQIVNLKKAKELLDTQFKEANKELQQVKKKEHQPQNNAGAKGGKQGDVANVNELESLRKKLKAVEQERDKLLLEVSKAYSQEKESRAGKSTAKVVPITSLDTEAAFAAKDRLIEELEAKLKESQGGGRPKEGSSGEQMGRLKAEHELALAAREKTAAEKVNKLLKEVDAHKESIQKVTEENNKLSAIIEELEKKGTVLSENIKRLEAEKVKFGDVFSKNKTLEEELEKLKVQISQSKADYSELEGKYKDSMTQRKKLHNIIEDMKGKIRVYCRVRPISQEEKKKGSGSVVNVADEFTLKVQTRNGPKAFSFDSVFGPDATQEKVFEDTKRLVQSAVDGYNVCIFAYGQTGAGKSFTIQGSPSNPGIAPRSFTELYKILSAMNNYTHRVECYMVELYLDTLSDLLLPKSEKKGGVHLDIKEDARGMVYIQGATKRVVSGPKDLMEKLEAGLSDRRTSATDMNANSSRSHLVFSILVECVHKLTSQRTLGKISFVDLAGSERADKAGTSAERLKEGRAINKSLTELGNVIMALSSGSRVVNEHRCEVCAIQEQQADDADERLHWRECKAWTECRRKR